MENSVVDSVADVEEKHRKQESVVHVAETAISVCKDTTAGLAGLHVVIGVQPGFPPLIKHYH